MIKLTYLLLNFDIGRHVPVTVCGRSGKAYGTALWSEKHNAHLLRLSEKEFDVTAARDIFGNRHRALSNWIVRAEAEPDAESPEGKLAAELDRVTTELTQCRDVLQLRDNRIAELHRQLAEQSENGIKAADTLPTEVIEAAGEKLKELGAIPAEPAQPEQPADPQPPQPGDRRAQLDAMPYREKRELAKELNAKGAKISLNGASGAELTEAIIEAEAALAAE